jgi:RimJ/RimL family protein N-acetyltransferase
MKNVILRSWSLDDIYYLQSFANNINISQFLRDKFPFPYTENDAVSFLKYAINSNSKYLLAIEVDKVAIGGIEVELMQDVYSINGELGFWVAEPYWKNGIATEAIRQIVLKVFNETSIERIFARTFATNYASIILLEKCGFVKEAEFKNTLIKFDKIYDEHVFAIRRENRDYI